MEYAISYLVTPAGLFWVIVAIVGGKVTASVIHSKITKDIAKYLTDEDKIDGYGSFGKN